MEVQATRRDAYDLVHRGIEAFARAERAGMRVGVEYCERKKAHLTRQVDHLENKFNESEFAQRWRKEYGRKMKLSSNDQLGYMLYHVWGVEPPKRTGTGKGSTDEETLNQIDLPELQYILRMRRLKKLRDTYLQNYLREQVGGFIHPFINLHTVKTYRSSQDSPNLQNVPSRDDEAMRIARRALFPRKGNQLLEVDFKGIEVSIGCCLHQDPTMLDYIRNPANDMHRDLAHQVFMLDAYDDEIEQQGFKAIEAFDLLRKATKNSFTFPQFYGDYYKNCAANYCRWTGLPPQGKWKAGQGPEMPDDRHLSDHLIDQDIKRYNDFEEHMRVIEEDFWGRRFRVYGQWREDWYNDYCERGYFDTPTGFRCSGLMTKNEVTNAPIQASAFHCLLWTFIRVDEIAREEGWQSRLVFQIHDALVVDVYPPELEHVARTVHRVATVELPQAWTWIITQLEVEADITDIDHSWADKQTYELPEVA